MSKTFEDQANKAKTLAEEMKKHLNELSDCGVKQDVLDTLINTSEEAISKSQEVDKLREVVSTKLHEANEVLKVVKDQYNDLRSIIKNNYPQEKWSKFGLMDKR